MVSDILRGPHVLAIHRSYVQSFRILGLMRMIRPGVNTQIAQLHAAQRPTRDHALDGLLDHTLGKTTLEDRSCGVFLDAADETGVLVVDLVVALATGQHRLRGVDDDDVIAAIDMRRVRRKVFAAKAYRDQ